MGKIIVSNLPNNFKENDIRTLFSVYGEIISITRSDKSNNAFIKYKTREECQNAISSMNGRVINKGEPLYVDIAYNRDNKVYVFNIPLDTSLDTLKDFFGYYGTIEHISFSKNILNLAYEESKDAIKLLDLDKKIKYNGNILSIVKKIDLTSDNSKCIYIYNIHNDLTELDLLKTFSKCGNIVSSGILEGNKAFINYDKEIGALKAVKYFDGRKLKNKSVRVVLKASKAYKNK